MTVEPLLETGAVTRWLLPQGFMLATTLEVEEATIGGLACAVGMTTASHVHGLLQETVVEFEIVLGDGTHIRARRDNEYWQLRHNYFNYIILHHFSLIPVCIRHHMRFV